MKNYLKIILLTIISVFFLSGCGWEDVQKEYGEELKKGVSCTYYSEAGKNDYYEVEQLEISADYDGAYAKFNSDNKNPLIGTNGGNNNVIFNGYTFKFHNDFLKSYLERYNDKKTCPETIYINRNSQELRIDDCEGLDYMCDSYKLKRTTITTPEGEKIDCHFSTATNCIKISKEKDNLGIEAYLEFGYYEVNGVTKKYFGVADNANYKNIKIDDNETDGFRLMFNIEEYEVITEAIDEIWLPNNQFIAVKDIVLKASYTTMTTYHISGPNTDNYGDFETGEVEEEPALDPDNSTNSGNSGNSSTGPNLNYDNICLNSGVSQTMMILGYVIQVIKWIAPLIIIALGMVDYGKAAISGDDKALSGATASLIKRIVAGLIIFVVPTIISVVTKNLVNTNVFDKANEFWTCTNCMVNPGDCEALVERLKAEEEAKREEAQDKYEDDKDKWNKENQGGEGTDSSFDTHINSINGIKYHLYNQSDDLWGNVKYSNGQTISERGCKISSVAVLASAYNTDITPKTVFDSDYKTAWPHDGVNNLSKNNFSCIKKTSIDFNEIKDSLKSGAAVIIQVKEKSLFTNSQHYMALIDIKSDKSQVFVGNSYGAGNGTYNRNGWFDSSVVLNDVHEVYFCTPSQQLINKHKNSNNSSSISGDGSKTPIVNGEQRALKEGECKDYYCSCPSIGNGKYSGFQFKMKDATDRSMSEVTGDAAIQVSVTCSNGMTYSKGVHSKAKTNFEAAFKKICDLQTTGINGIKLDSNTIQLGGTIVQRLNSDRSICSMHAYGLAIDINSYLEIKVGDTTYKPYATQGSGMRQTYNKFVDAIGGESNQLNVNYILWKYAFEPNGFVWGGNWGDSYFDPMHFEIKI